MAFALAREDAQTHTGICRFGNIHANTHTHTQFINIINCGWHAQGLDIYNSPQRIKD